MKLLEKIKHNFFKKHSYKFVSKQTAADLDGDPINVTWMEIYRNVYVCNCCGDIKIDYILDGNNVGIFGRNLFPNWYPNIDFKSLENKYKREDKLKKLLDE